VADAAQRRQDHWLKRGVIYEVFVREFSTSGRLTAVERRLPELQRLGVTTLWLMPLQPVGRTRRKGQQGSPYAVRDHRALDPAYGRPADLRRLVRRAHGLGLRVILDWVAGHTAWDHPWVRRHPGWYRKDHKGQIRPPRKAWWDVARLDLRSPRLTRALVDAMLHWVRAYGVDGFRCDAAWSVPPAHWLQVRRALSAERPDIGLLAEADRPRLMQDAFQLTYDYPWYFALRRALRGAALEEIWQRHRAFGRRYPPGAQRMLFIDNHDQRRCVAQFGEPASLALAVLLLTSEGVPLIYNGQEIGDRAPSRAPALFRRHPIDWDHPRPGFLSHYRRLIRIRRRHAALSRGETRPLGRGGRVLRFLRRHGRRQVLVAVNLSPEPRSVRIRSRRFQPAGQLLSHGGLRAGTRLRAGDSRVALDGWGWLVCR
jgi:glycosidase